VAASRCCPQAPAHSTLTASTTQRWVCRIRCVSCITLNVNSRYRAALCSCNQAVHGQGRVQGHLLVATSRGCQQVSAHSTLTASTIQRWVCRLPCFSCVPLDVNSRCQAAQCAVVTKQRTVRLWSAAICEWAQAGAAHRCQHTQSG
jgi:hypothetical protein